MTGALQNGRWVDSYNLGDKLSQWPMYVRPCTQEGPYFDSFWVGDSTHGACFRSIYNEGERFTWVPDTDQQVFYPWSASNMCRMMNGRNVLIVGDSLSQQFYETFLSAMLFQAFPFKDREASEDSTVDSERFGRSKRVCEEFCPYNQVCQPNLVIDSVLSYRLDS